MLAASLNNHFLVKILLERNPDISIKDKAGRNVLHIACRAGSTKVLELLMSHPDANDLSEERTNGGLTPLMFAVATGKQEIIKFCLNNSMCPFSEDTLGQNAYDYARQFPSVNGNSMTKYVDAARQ